MIRRVTIKNFKRFGEHTFDLADSMVLAGPNNAGKSTLLQALAMWKFCLNRWLAQREGGKAVKRSGVPIPRPDITVVPLREMNLLWENRKVTGPKGMSGARRLIEIDIDGETDGEQWSCGIELDYANPELFYARPKNAKKLDIKAIQRFPPDAARALDIVYIPPLSGIEHNEPRRERGMQDLLIGQGKPGDILRNLLWEVSENDDGSLWQELAKHIHDLFQIELRKPIYSPVQPYIICEYREPGCTRPLDLCNVGSGTLQVLLLVAFLYGRPASVILLDEPDSHQHIILQRQIYDLIRKVAHNRHKQVLVATHSEVVLDATAPERVLGFFGQTARPLASKTERDQVREALKRVTTTDILLGEEVRGILYVEGESDEQILTEWARILNHPAQEFLRRAFVHVLGGRNLREANDHFFAMKAVVNDIHGLCLIDGDNLDFKDEDSSKTGLLILRWRRYEIENYLLQPKAIKRFMNLPLMEAQVDEEFWKQVPRGTDLLGEHVALSRVKASEEFLIPILQRVGMDTRKRDLHLLAAKMHAEEIHPEIVEKLDHIANHLGRS